MKTVYVLDDRANQIYMHWFLFVIAGLRDIPVPALIHTRITEDFQRDTLRLLEPDYTYVESIDGYTPVYKHGAPLLGGFHVADPYYGFVRSLLLSRIPPPINSPTRLLYISRARAHAIGWRQVSGQKSVKHLLNEDEILPHLKRIGFECVFLEDYSLLEKIHLFQTAKVIVSPSGGALTTCFFADQKTQVIELRNDGSTQYYHVCEVLGIPITQYSGLDHVSDGTENYRVRDIPDFLRVVQTIVESSS